MPKVDWGSVNTGFEPVSPGWYDAELTDWKLAQGGKGPYYQLTYTLRGEGVNNRKVFDNVSISPGGAWKFKDNFLKLGARKQDLEPGSDVDTDDIVRECVGAECRLLLSIEEYEANDKTMKERNKVEQIQSPAVSLAYNQP